MLARLAYIVLGTLISVNLGMISFNGSVDWKQPLATGTLTLLSTFIGALLAFQLAVVKDRKKKDTDEDDLWQIVTMTQDLIDFVDNIIAKCDELLPQMHQALKKRYPDNDILYLKMLNDNSVHPSN